MASWRHRTSTAQAKVAGPAEATQHGGGGGGGGSTFDLTSSPIVYIRNIILVKILGGSPPPFVPPALSRKSQFCARTIKSIEASHFLSIYELEPLRHAVVFSMNVYINYSPSVQFHQNVYFSARKCLNYTFWYFLRYFIDGYFRKKIETNNDVCSIYLNFLNSSFY